MCDTGQIHCEICEIGLFKQQDLHPITDKHSTTGSSKSDMIWNKSV